MPGHFYNVSLDLKEENQVTSVQKKIEKKRWEIQGGRGAGRSYIYLFPG